LMSLLCHFFYDTVTAFTWLTLPLHLKMLSLSLVVLCIL
jgi:hypothetical protein